MLWFINTHTIYTSKGRGLFPAFFVVHGAMTQVEYVLFDCDGVLVDSEALTQSVLQQSFARYGLQIETPEIAGLFVGGTMRGAMMTARSRGAALPEDWLDQINTELFGVLADHCEVISGVPEMLDQLDRAGIGYGICSNGPLAKMQVTLGRCGLWDRFEGRIFSAHDCSAAKPAPDVYLKGAASAGIPPANCVVIEDSATGAKAGRAAGMRCFGYCADMAPAKLAPHCDLLFEDMRALPALLGLT